MALICTGRSYRTPALTSALTDRSKWSAMACSARVGSRWRMAAAIASCMSNTATRSASLGAAMPADRAGFLDHHAEGSNDQLVERIAGRLGDGAVEGEVVAGDLGDIGIGGAHAGGVLDDGCRLLIGAAHSGEGSGP